MTTSETVTTAIAAALVPPGPEQVSEYDTLAENGPMACVPLPATPPLQPSEAVQEVALLELHVKVDDPPVGTTEGAAANVAVGTMLTVTLAVALVPPPPVHSNEKVVAPVSAAEVCVPLVASEPVQPPEAVQELALVELHVRVADSPLLTVVFETLSVAVGGGGPDPPPQSATRNAKKMPAHDWMDRMAPLFLVDSYGVGLIVRHDRQRCRSNCGAASLAVHNGLEDRRAVYITCRGIDISCAVHAARCSARLAAQEVESANSIVRKPSRAADSTLLELSSMKTLSIRCGCQRTRTPPKSRIT